MLDLTTISGNAYEIKLLDGKVYHLKRPTQQLFTTLLGLTKYTEGDNTEELLSVTSQLLLRILNRNVEGVQFTQDDLDEQGYDFVIAMAVITDYIQFYSKEITAKVDFPTTQQTKATA